MVRPLRLKSPVFSSSVGTLVLMGKGTRSRSPSKAAMKKVLPLRSGPEARAPYWFAM
jgi:hypothetical protein